MSKHLECPITGYEFVIEMGMNGHNESEAKRNLDRMMPDVPYFFTDTATKTYIKRRMKEAGDKMGEHTDNGQQYEYYKGRFLAFREILYPNDYGDTKESDKDEND